MAQQHLRWSLLACIVLGTMTMTMVGSVPVPDEYAQPQGYGGGGHHGRVKIQVYRGPSEAKSGYESFAPWGFYVTQPKDRDIYQAYGNH